MLVGVNELEKELEGKLNEYKIDGNIAELYRIIFSNALVITSFDDIISVLSKNKTNYLRLGYGETLFNAYENGYIKGKSCKLVHIYFREGGMNLQNLCDFIESFGKDIIFGYTKDETINHSVKLAMIFN